MDDLILHCLITAGIVLALYGVGLKLLYASLIAIAIGVAKELVDGMGHGTQSFTDILADMAGILLGVGLAYGTREVAKKLPKQVKEPIVQGRQTIKLKLKRYNLKVRDDQDKDYDHHKAKQVMNADYKKSARRDSQAKN